MIIKCMSHRINKMLVKDKKMNNYIDELLQDPKYKKIRSFLQRSARRRETSSRKEATEREKVNDIAKRIKRLEKWVNENAG